MTQDKTCSVGFSVVKSQGLEDTQLNFGELKYDYKDEIASCGLHLGKYRKFRSLSSFYRNVVLLSNRKRGFSVGPFVASKSLRDIKVNMLTLLKWERIWTLYKVFLKRLSLKN